MKRIIRICMFFFALFIVNVKFVYASETMDTTPVIQSISVMTEKIEAPGEVQIAIGLAQKKSLQAVNMVFRMQENGKTLYYWLGQEDIHYSESNNINICTISLAETVVEGSYQLTEIELIDQEEQSAVYVVSEEGLKNWTNECEIQKVELLVSCGCKDRDFQAPELNEISADQMVEAGSFLNVNIKVYDESGLKSAKVVYYHGKTETYLYLEPVEKVYNAEKNIYTFTYKIPKYQDAGSYEFDSVCLTDNSAHENSITYWRSGSLLTNLDNQSLSVSECRYLQIDFDNSGNAASILKQNLYKVVSQAEANSTVIYRGGDSKESLWILDDSSLEKAKNNQLTLLLPDMFTDSEIIIDAKQLPNNLPEEIYTGFLLKELSEGIYDIKIQMTHPQLPFTVKFKMDSLNDFKYYEFLFYKIDEEGNTELMDDTLGVNKEGYVFIEFPEGIQNEEEWSHFQLIKTEPRECTEEHEWGEEVSIAKATVTQPGTAQSVCENCGETKIKDVAKIGSLTLAAAKYIYDGKKKTPALTVKDVNNKKLVKGTDYELKYPDTGKNVGRYLQDAME